MSRAPGRDDYTSLQMKKFAPTFRPPRPRLFAPRDPGVVVGRQIVEIQARLETRRFDLIDRPGEREPRLHVLAAVQIAPDVPPILKIPEEPGDELRLVLGLQLVVIERIGVGTADDVRECLARRDPEEQGELRLCSGLLPKPLPGYARATSRTGTTSICKAGSAVGT